MQELPRETDLDRIVRPRLDDKTRDLMTQLVQLSRQTEPAGQALDQQQDCQFEMWPQTYGGAVPCRPERVWKSLAM